MCQVSSSYHFWKKMWSRSIVSLSYGQIKLLMHVGNLKHRPRQKSGVKNIFAKSAKISSQTFLAKSNFAVGVPLLGYNCGKSYFLKDTRTLQMEFYFRFFQKEKKKKMPDQVWHSWHTSQFRCATLSNIDYWVSKSRPWL